MRLQEELAEIAPDAMPAWAKVAAEGGEHTILVKVRFRRGRGPGQAPEEFDAWCNLGPPQLEEMAPSLLWFCLKLTLFTCGALVMWKRPDDRAARQFYLLCVVTLGAYMGGYLWTHIATAPVLLVGFMVCGVMLAPISLHFYLVFPRPKYVLLRRPRWTLAAVYALPLAVLLALLGLYLRVRWLFHHGQPEDVLNAAVAQFLHAIYLSISMSSVWYVASVLALVHSYWTITDLTERNQVKWIFYGALLSLVPIGYALSLAIWWPDEFGAGGATWPMFAASVLVTAAFIVSITRYRLLELDQIVSAGVIYFFLAGLVYYAVIFLGTLAFNRVIAGPRLSEAVRVCTTALVLLIVLDLARSRLRKALDRRFSREKYQLDRTLQRMGEAVRQLVDPPALLQRLLQASAELLGVSAGAVYLRQGEPPAHRLAGSLGPGRPPADLTADCQLLAALGGGEAVSTRSGAGAALSPAQEQLRALGGDVAHPLMHEGGLMAVLVLGPRARAPYRQEDLNLLAAFAHITTLALASAERHQTIDFLRHDLQAKVEKIAEQQRRILALQSQLRKQWAVGSGPGAAVVNAAAGRGGRARADGGAGNPPSQPAAPCPLPAAAGIIGSSPAVRDLLHLVRKVAVTDAVVLIRGESGTGKELLAQAVHAASSRAGKSFVKVHCAALSPTLLESELFGHVKGAFTGAITHKTGRFELANGGTLFLDEIGDVSLEVQTKLLRVLQEKTIERVGSSESVKVDVRILAATHQDLEALIRRERFREDLFYRLNVIEVVVPPLRQRREDIAELALYFLEHCAARCKKAVTQIDDDALSLLKGHSWPGNIRQLENVIERAVVIAEGQTITAADLPGELVEAALALPLAAWPEEDADPVGAGGLSLKREDRERRERELIVRALQAAAGNKAEAARALGLARSTLISRLKRYGLG